MEKNGISIIKKLGAILITGSSATAIGLACIGWAEKKGVISEGVAQKFQGGVEVLGSGIDGHLKSKQERADKKAEEQRNLATDELLRRIDGKVEEIRGNTDEIVSYVRMRMEESAAAAKEQDASDKKGNN